MFLTNEKYRQIINPSASFDIAVLADNLNRAVNNFILPYLGQAQLESLKTKYDGNTLNPTETKLLEIVQRLQAHAARYYNVDFEQVTENNHAMTIINSGTELSPKLWQVNNIKENIYQHIYEIVEQLLHFLETNKASFPLWTASEQYTWLKNTLLQSATEFDKIIHINKSRLLFNKLKNLIYQSEISMITEITGIALYQQILLQTNSNSLTADNKTVTDLCKFATAFTVFADALETLPIVVGANGVYKLSQTQEQSSGNIRNPSDLHTIGIAITNYKTKAADYKDKLAKYLFANADTYPLYKSSTAYTSLKNQITVNCKTDKVVSF